MFDSSILRPQLNTLEYQYEEGSVASSISVSIPANTPSTYITIETGEY